MNNKIFITGGTGYIGKRLIPELLKRNFEVHALARKESLSKLPEGCKAIIGSALDHLSFAEQIAPCKTFIHLIGVPHPSPAKKELFEKIDFVSIRESILAAKKSGIEHFIYVSVAQETVIMKAYQEVRKQGEELIRNSGLNATILRPWYVVGPGHYWPLIFLPVYKIFDWIPATKEKAVKMALVTINQMVSMLAHASEHPTSGVEVISVPTIKKIACSD